VTRQTTTTLYGTAEAAAFAPGYAFLSAWTTLPQPARQVKTIDGPRTDVTDVTTYVYYPVDDAVPAAWRGRLAAVKNAAGHVTYFQDYDVFGNATVIDANRVVTSSTSDLLGRRTSTSVFAERPCIARDPGCTTPETSFRTYGTLASPKEIETLAGGGVIVTEFDSRGRVTQLSRGPSSTDLRERIETTYDAGTGLRTLQRFLAWETNAWVEKRREGYVYDGEGRLAELVHADDSRVVYGYTPDGQVTTVRDENHVTPNTTSTWDPAGRLAAVTQVLSTLPARTALTSYQYDADSNLAAVTDPNGNVTTCTYDDLGNLLRQQSPVTGLTTYTYDEAGQVLTTTDANGAVTTRTYDALGRVLTAQSARGGLTTENVSWEYDFPEYGIGRLRAMNDPLGGTVYDYDRSGHLIAEARTTSGTLHLTKFSWDANGNRTSVTYPSGNRVDYSFDFAGRPVSASLVRAGVTSPIVTAEQHLPFGPATLGTYGNGLQRTNTYDSRYRMLTNKLAGGGATLADHRYQYDAAGNVLAIADALNPDYDRGFGYDDLNRLTSSTTGLALWRSATYRYDAMGNLLSIDQGHTGVEPEGLGSRQRIRTDNSLVRTLDFSFVGTTPKLSRVTGFGTLDAGVPAEGTPGLLVGTPVDYDAAGNELRHLAERSYSPRNLMSAIQEWSEAGPAHRVEYGYDGRGVRVSRSESPTGGAAAAATRHYVYSPELQLLAVTADDQPSIWTEGEPSSALEILWFDGKPVAQIRGAGPVTYTFPDHLGTPLLQTATDATVVWQAEYEPFGTINEMRTGLRGDQPLRFPGQEFAHSWEGSDEHYNIFRWYRAGWGRYTSADPVGLRGGVNLFAYGEGNPIRWADPLGLRVFKCCAPAMIAAGLIDHCWLKTDTREGGLGDLDVGQPAGQAAAVGDRCGGLPYLVQTQVVNHAGQSSSRRGATCAEITDVNEQCVNDEIWTNSRGYGATRGAWTPFNQCQSFVNDVLRKCRKKKCNPTRPSPPGDDGRRYF
jgi:RHS repeat-associated protein